MRIEHWWFTVRLRLRSILRRNRVEQELAEELQFHLDHKIEEGIANGLSPEEARYAALRAMGGLDQRKEEMRDARRISVVDILVKDLRFAVRTLSKSPAFTAVTVITLALAIGANAVVFGLMNGLILRPLNVPRPESLYSIEYGNSVNASQSYPDYLDLRDRNRSFEDLAAYTFAQVGLDTGENPSSLWITTRSPETISRLYTFSRISAVCFTAPMRMGRTALLILCSAMRFGTRAFKTTPAWWAASFKSTSILSLSSE
jgi:hypothetical protein